MTDGQEILAPQQQAGLSRRALLRRGLALGLGVSAASLLAACGGGATPAAAPTSAPAAAPTTAPAAAPTTAAAGAPTTAAAAGAAATSAPVGSTNDPSKVATLAAAPAPTAAPTSAAAPTTAPAAAPTTAAAGGAKPALTKPVNVLVFGGYDIASMAKEFQEKNGVAVNYTPFNANEEAYNKLKAGGLEQYDVVQADSFYFQKYWKEGMIDLLDYNDLESSKTLLPQFANIEIWQQDGKHLAYPSMWAPYPIVYNSDKVKPAPDSWGVLWDEKYKGKIAMLDRPVEPIIVTALFMGFKEPFALTPDQLKQVEAKLLEQKPLIRAYWQDAEGLTNQFVSGEFYVAIAFGPGAASAVRDKGTPAEAVIPKEGTMGWIDGSALIKGTKNKEGAIRWIDFHYRPEGYLTISQTVPFGVPNAKAIELLKAQGKQDYITSTMSDRPDVAHTMYHYRPPNDIDAYTAVWNRVLAA